MLSVSRQKHCLMSRAACYELIVERKAPDHVQWLHKLNREERWHQNHFYDLPQIYTPPTPHWEWSYYKWRYNLQSAQSFWLWNTLHLNRCLSKFCLYLLDTEASQILLRVIFYKVPFSLKIKSSVRDKAELGSGLVYKEFITGSRIWKILNQNNINIFSNKRATVPSPNIYVFGLKNSITLVY